jgi:hypothetical protein
MVRIGRRNNMFQAIVTSHHVTKASSIDTGKRRVYDRARSMGSSGDTLTIVNLTDGTTAYRGKIR